MSNIVGGLDILRQWRFSAVLEHQAAAVRMTLNPAWKIDFIDPEDVQAPLRQQEEARRQVSSSVTTTKTAQQKQQLQQDGKTTDASSSRYQQQQQLLRDQIPKMFLVPFLAFTDETMAPRKGASDLLSGFSVGWAATIKKIKMFYSPLPPPLHQPTVASAEDEADELETNRMKTWCKRCVQHVLEDNRVVSIDGNKKLRKLRTKTMLSPEQRITLGQYHHGFRFNIVYEQKGEMTPQSNAIALCVCSKSYGYMILVECVSQNELDNYVLNVLIKTWLSDAKRFELGAEITGYSDAAASLRQQQTLFGELVFTDNDAAIAFRLPMHPMTLRPDHSPTVPPATGSLCCVTLDLLLHQKLSDDDDANAIGGKMRLVNVVLVVEIEDLLKEPHFPTVFSGDEYANRRHERFTEVFKDSRVIGLPLSVPIGRRTGRSTTCTFSTVMNDAQALVKSTTVTTLVGSHGASATYFTKLGHGMFDAYLYLYQHLLTTLTFFAERDISGTFSRYRSVPIRILEADLTSCYNPHGSTDPTARLAALQKHITALRAASDGEVEGMNMTDIVQIDESMMNEATGSASAKMINGGVTSQHQQQQQGAAFSENVPDDTTAGGDGESSKKKSPEGEAANKRQQQLTSPVSDEQQEGQYYLSSGDQDGLQIMNSRRFTDTDSVISVTDIPRLMSEELAMLEEEEERLARGEGGGDADQSNVLSGSPSAANMLRSKSPQVDESGGDHLFANQNTNDGTMNAISSTQAHLDKTNNNLDTTSELMLLPGGGGRGGGGETPGPGGDTSRLSSYHHNTSQQHAGTSNQVSQSHTGIAGSVGGAFDDRSDRTAQSTLEGGQNIMMNQDGGFDNNNIATTSRAATAGTTSAQQQKVSIVEPVDMDDQNPDSVTAGQQQQHQRGKPTQQQLQDLAEALELIGDGSNKNKSKLDQDIDAVLDATQEQQQGDQQDNTNNSASNNKKSNQAGGKDDGSSSSSLRNSYTELCKEEGCRPNSYLLQKLPVIPRIAQTIEALDMSHNYVGHSGFIAILRLLDLLPRVHSVYFNSMSLDNQDVVVLCDTLAEHTTIHSVFLKNNPRITLPAAKSFFRLLKDNINIHTVSLTGTGIGLSLQQRIEKDAQTNKEIQLENEQRRKQEQQQLRDSSMNDSGVVGAAASSSAFQPGPMTTLTVGAPHLAAASSTTNTNINDDDDDREDRTNASTAKNENENEQKNENNNNNVTVVQEQQQQQHQIGNSSTVVTPVQNEGTTPAVDSQKEKSNSGGGGSPDRVVVVG